jgi:hypothetical protein
MKIAVQGVAASGRDSARSDAAIINVGPKEAPLTASPQGSSGHAERTADAQVGVELLARGFSWPSG